MKTFKVNVEYRVGDIVYVVTDASQSPHQVTEIVLKDKDIFYGVSTYSDVYWFYGFQLSPERNDLLRLEGDLNPEIDSEDEEDNL